MERDPWDELAEELVHGSEEGFVAALTERMLGLLARGCANPDEFYVIVSRAREAALGVWAEWSGRVSRDTERAFTQALSREQEAIEATLASAFGPIDPALTARGQNEVTQAARGMSSILARQNVALADNLADEWWHATSDAVTRIQLGDDLDDVIRDGVRRLSAAGLETIDYKSGAHTSIDAAVRRHAITQQNQCRNDMLVRDCDTYGVDLVFTSAHYGSRPEHAVWQGKPFSLHGTVEVDGVKYRDLAEATGYGTVTGLCGANCRHRLTPYIPGLSELPDTDFSEFEAKYHMTSDEYYEATQKQRAMERRIRQTKREIALGEAQGLDMTEARYRLGDQQKQLKEHCDRLGLPRDYRREKAYAVANPDGGSVAIGTQPRALSAKPASPAPFILRTEEDRNHLFVTSGNGTTIQNRRDSHRITIKGGQTIIIDDAVDKSFQPELIKQFRKLPKKVKEAVRTIEVVSYENPFDPFWRDYYARQGIHFENSAATGKNGVITIYLSGTTQRGLNLLYTIAHEGGHCFDETGWSTGLLRMSARQEWNDAVRSDRQHCGLSCVSGYHDAYRPTEEYAESLAMVVLEQNGDNRTYTVTVNGREQTLSARDAFPARFNYVREVIGYGH